MKPKSRSIWYVFLILLATGIMSTDGAWSASLRDEMVARAKAEGSLVIVGSNAGWLRTGLDGFRRRYPFIKITDMAMNTGSTVNRVSLEAKAGRLTIDWAGISEDGSEVLVRRGLNAKLEEIYDPAAQKKSEQFFFQLLGLR